MREVVDKICPPRDGKQAARRIYNAAERILVRKGKRIACRQPFDACFGRHRGNRFGSRSFVGWGKPRQTDGLDGLLDLLVESTDEANVHCRVITGGVLTSNKGINLPKAHLSIASITEKDQEDLTFALSQRVDWVALSFVRRAEDVYQLRELISQQCEFGRVTPTGNVNDNHPFWTT